MINRKFLRHIDFTLPVLVLLIIIIGMVFIASSTHIYDATAYRLDYLQRQIVSAIVGFILMIAVVFFDYRILKDYALFIYAGTILLLCFNMLSGISSIAAKRTIYLGPLSFQPSELAKLAVIFLLASVLSQENLELTWGKVMQACLITFLPFILILRTDLGTALVLGVILLLSLFVAGFPGIYIVTFLFSTVAFASAWVFLHMRFGVWIPLKEYQLMRLMIFTNPGMDPSGWGYQQIQSKIAIGSGGFLGKGLFSGTQTRLNFLPAQHTDFIFSVISEEFGFLGAFSLLVLYALLLVKGIRIATRSKDKFGLLIAVCITGMFAFHVIVNVGMTMGILPITGLPLPFVSFGGSSLITNLMAIGILINISMRKQKIYF